MLAVDDAIWRLLLYLRETEQGLTEEQLQLRADEPVSALLERAAGEGMIYREAGGLYRVVPERFPLLDGQIDAGLREGAAARRLYFAFGSNMDPYQMFAGHEARMRGTRYLCRAEAPGWFLGFPRRSAKWGGGVAGLLQGRPGATTWGVIFLMRPGDWRILEEYIGVPRAFTQTPIEIRVHRPEAEPLGLTALTYFPVVDGSGTRPPAFSYMAHIRAGARAFDLPEGYQEWLEGIRTDPDLIPPSPSAGPAAQAPKAEQMDELGFPVAGYRHWVVKALREEEWTLARLRRHVAQQANQPWLAYNSTIAVFCGNLQIEPANAASPDARGLTIRGWEGADEGTRLTIQAEDYRMAVQRYEGGQCHVR